MNESCLVWIRHVTYERVMSHVAHAWFVFHQWFTHEWVIYTYNCVMLHLWMSHVTHMNESCHTYECVMSHIWMRHVTHMNESCHTYECALPCATRTWAHAMLHIRISHICLCSMYVCMCYVTHMNGSCCLRGIFAARTQVLRLYAVWMGHVLDVCHTRERFMVTNRQVMSHAWTSHVAPMNKSHHRYKWVMSHVYTRHVTHVNESCQTYERGMSPIWMPCHPS